MVTEVPTKLRLVRCPKCRKVLPELPNVPVYQCGGCHTILQAKRRIKDTELLNHETDRSEKIHSEQSSEDREPHRSIQEESSSAGALLLNQNNGSDQSKIKEKNTKQLEEAHTSSELTQELACHAKEEGTGYGGARLSDGAASSIELDHQHESVESSPEAQTHNVMNENMNSSPRGLNINSNEVVLSTEVDHEVSEVPLRQMGGRRDEEVDDYHSRKLPEEVNFSNEVASPSDFNHQLSERSSIDAKSFDEEKDNHDYADESKADNENGLGSVKFSGELSSSADKVDGITNALEQCSSRDEDNNQYFNQKQPEFVSFPDEVASSAELKNYLVRNKGSNGSDSGGWKREYHGTMMSSGELSSSNEHISQNVEEFSPATGPNTELKLEVKIPISSESWSDEKASMGHRFSRESFLTDGFISPHNEHMEHDQNLISGSPGNSMAHRFSGESFLTDGVISPRDEHMAQYQNRARNGNEGVGTHIDMPKSRTIPINYAYEGSVSSYDEDDDPFSLRKVHLSRRKLKEAAEAGSSRTVMKSDGGVDKVRSGFPATQSVSPEYNCFATKSSQLRLAELEELAKNALPVRNRMKFRPDEGPSKAPSYSKSHRAGYENRNHLNFANNNFNRPSKRPEDLEEEKIELLKMVYDLQKELKRTQISSGTARFSGDHAESEVGLFRSAFSCNQGRRPYQSRDSRVPFSAEAATTRRRQDGGGSYCVHCCPQEWRLQPLLPPHSCCYKSQSLFHSGRRSYNLHHQSGGSTPQHYQNSELSDDRWFMDHETRRIHQEKAQMAKRHVRPIVGGAPLVACYKCSELLQMPADFLHSKRKKLHWLQCGGCSAVLKFSLHGGTNIVPYEVYAAGDDDVNATVAPPPSEVDSFSKFASPSQATERDPSSGDYGPPVSYSTEAEPSNVDRQNGRKNRSGERKEEGLLKGLGKKIYNSAGGYSSKMSKTKRMMSSEIQEAPSSGSPLHKLMGYSSPSKVIER